MNETDYNRTEMLAKRVHELLIYELRGSLQSVATSAYVMQVIIEDIDDSCMQDDDIAMLKDLSSLVIDMSERMLSSTNTFREEVDIILRNKDYR